MHWSIIKKSSPMLSMSEAADPYPVGAAAGLPAAVVSDVEAAADTLSESADSPIPLDNSHTVCNSLHLLHPNSLQGDGQRC